MRDDFLYVENPNDRKTNLFYLLENQYGGVSVPNGSDFDGKPHPTSLTGGSNTNIKNAAADLKKGVDGLNSATSDAIQKTKDAAADALGAGKGIILGLIGLIFVILLIEK